MLTGSNNCLPTCQADFAGCSRIAYLLVNSQTCLLENTMDATLRVGVFSSDCV